MEVHEKEAAFIQAMKQVNEIDNVIVSFQEKFNEGMADLAFLRFRDEIKGFSLNPSSFVVCPALRVLSSNNNDQICYKLIDKKDYKFSLPTEEDIEDENSDYITEEVERRLIKGKKLSHDEMILDSFGFDIDDSQIIKIQKSFKEALNQLISLANILKKIEKQKK